MKIVRPENALEKLARFLEAKRRKETALVSRNGRRFRVMSRYGETAEKFRVTRLDRVGE